MTTHLSGYQRGLGLQGSSLKYAALQGSRTKILGLHNISFEAPGFTVIKLFRAPRIEIIGLRARQQKFRGSRAPSFGTLTYELTLNYSEEKIDVDQGSGSLPVSCDASIQSNLLCNSDTPSTACYGHFG